MTANENGKDIPVCFFTDWDPSILNYEKDKNIIDILGTTGWHFRIIQTKVQIRPSLHDQPASNTKQIHLSPWGWDM